jgi:anti-sigma factor RsiW
MAGSCEEYEILITGYLDGELDQDTQVKLEAHMQGCSACKREYESMKGIVVGTDAVLTVAEPPEEVWDTFLDEIYNRAERQTGWVFLILGVVAVVFAVGVLFVQSTVLSPMEKMLIVIPLVGLAILFLSVLRQRLQIAKTDRYSKEIHR